MAFTDNNGRTFLDKLSWESESWLVWKEIVDRWGEADYGDETKCEAHKETLKKEWESKHYIRDRGNAYPSIQEQLDMQYHDEANGTTSWKDAIAKIKADNPKT